MLSYPQIQPNRAAFCISPFRGTGLRNLIDTKRFLSSEERQLVGSILDESISDSQHRSMHLHRFLEEYGFFSCAPFILADFIPLPEIVIFDHTGIGKEMVRMLYFFDDPRDQHIFRTSITSGNGTVSFVLEV